MENNRIDRYELIDKDNFESLYLDDMLNEDSIRYKMSIGIIKDPYFYSYFDSILVESMLDSWESYNHTFVTSTLIDRMQTE